MTDTINFTAGMYTNVNYLATGADSGTISRNSSRLNFTGIESIVDNSTAANRIFDYVADTTAKVTLGGEFSAGQVWSINVDSSPTPYSHTVIANDSLENIVADLAYKIAQGGYITSVLENSILITKLNGAPAVTASVPSGAVSSVDAASVTDVSLIISKDTSGNVSITSANGTFAKYAISGATGNLRVNAGLGSDSITVEQFSSARRP